MPTQEAQTVTKETQKVILKAICENPTLTVEDLALFLKSRMSKISQDEIVQVIHSLSPNKNWHRATEEDIQKEVLDYVWTLENQILFLLPTKQKETTTAEFNQIRLQNKQPKAPKDIIRHIQSTLLVDGKNLARFRKFQKDLTILNDLDINTQAVWLSRFILASISLEKVSEVHQLSTLLANEYKEKFPAITDKVGKTLQRICERIVEKYFPKNTSETRLKELVTLYQSIYNIYKKVSEGEIHTQGEIKDQNKQIENIIETLKEIQEIVSESHEGGFLSKLTTGQVKNKEGIIKRVDNIIDNLNLLNESNNKTNKIISDKSLIVQKLQSDYENILLVKSQLEHDLFNLNDKLKSLEEKNSNMEKELQDKTESLEKVHEKIASLQKKADEIPEYNSRNNLLREELNTAKNIALSLYSRVNKLKEDISKQIIEKSKSIKPNGEQKASNGNQTFHKVQQDQETGQTTLTTETSATQQV